MSDLREVDESTMLLRSIRVWTIFIGWCIGVWTVLLFLGIAWWVLVAVEWQHSIHDLTSR